MSKSDPNFLNRWLDRNPLSPLTRCRYFLTIPAFNIQSGWKGYSDIVGAYNYISPNLFTLKDINNWAPIAPNYTLCIAYANADHSVVRYRLWTAVGETIYSNIPLYDGQVIKKKFRFEIWNSSSGVATQTTDLTPILTSVLQNVDYRYGADALLTIPTEFVTKFDSNAGITQPDQTNLMVWLDGKYGISYSSGNSVASWADRTGNLIMRQNILQQQPTSSVAGYVQFLQNANMVASNVINVGVGVYFLRVLSGPVTQPNNNTIFNQHGAVSSSSLVMNPQGGMVAQLGPSSVPTTYATGSITIVEINTVTGQVYVHDPATGISTLQGVSATTFLDTLNLTLGGGSPGGFPILDEFGNIILDEQGNPILSEFGATTLNAGFDLFELLAYTSQTVQGRNSTLQYLLQGLPLPFIFPVNATLTLNP